MFFVSTISGVDVLLLLKKVLKWGPWKVSLPLSMNFFIALPTLLQLLLFRIVCLAFRSAMIYVGVFCVASLWKSVKGRYGLRGGRYVIAIAVI